jgi:hypothetical protein
MDQNFQADVLAQNLFLREAEWTFYAEFQPRGWPLANYASLADFREVFGEYEEGNVQMDLPGNELFRSQQSGDYTLNDVPGLPEGMELPGSIADLLGWKAAKPGLGAFAQFPTRK